MAKHTNDIYHTPRGPYVEPIAPVRPPDANHMPHYGYVVYAGGKQPINYEIDTKHLVYGRDSKGNVVTSGNPTYSMGKDGSYNTVGPKNQDKYGRYLTNPVRVLFGAGSSRNLRNLVAPVEPRAPKPPKSGRIEDNIAYVEKMQKYEQLYKSYKTKLAEHKKALDDYQHKKGPIWEKYYKDVADYNRRHDNWEERKRKQKNAILFKEQEKAYAKQRSSFKKTSKRIGWNGGKWNGVNYAGYTPWSPKYGEFERLTKKQYEGIGADYNKIKKPEKKKIQLANGTTAEVIDSHLGVPLGFKAMAGYEGASQTTVNEKGISSMDYAKNAFDGKHKTHSSDGCGHIKHVEYSAYFQLLKVTFWNDEICIYYRVPSTVAAELLRFAETKVTSTNTFDGSERHVLGIRFWDLVRIRGTKHGSRYRFEYDPDGAKYESTGGHGGRPSSGEYAEVTQLGDKESEGYNVNKLKQAMDDFVKDNGRRPTPDEYKDIIAKLHSESGESRSTGGHKYGEDGLPKTTKAKVGKDTEAQFDWATTDQIDDYFETKYNRDLTNKKIDTRKLQQAYYEYNDMSKDMDEQMITKLLRQAGVNI